MCAALELQWKLPGKCLCIWPPDRGHTEGNRGESRPVPVSDHTHNTCEHLLFSQYCSKYDMEKVSKHFGQDILDSRVIMNQFTFFWCKLK